MIQVYQVVILVLSAVVHEYMHGWMAYRLGDSTAKDAGRLTMNPLAHLEWFGSFFLPLVMIFGNFPFVIGWAKPVPYNPYNLEDKKYGEAKVAAAGPLANLIIALVFGLFLRWSPFYNLEFFGFISLIVFINLVLMVFNLVPIPPLDGSKILASFLPDNLRDRYLGLEKMGFILVILFVMLGGRLIMPVVNMLFRFILGS
jgi:Zn-dependent protease